MIPVVYESITLRQCYPPPPVVKYHSNKSSGLKLYINILCTVNSNQYEPASCARSTLVRLSRKHVDLYHQGLLCIKAGESSGHHIVSWPSNMF